jgi:hypothetical protein
MKLSSITATLVLATSVLALPHARNEGTPQANQADQVQNNTVTQDSGDITIWIGSGVSIGSINTGNSANVSSIQPADQTNHKGGSGSSKQPNKQINKAKQGQNTTVDQDSGDVALRIEGDGVSIGSINTGNSANVSAIQPADQSNHMGPNDGSNKTDKQNNQANQVQNITVDQKSGDVMLWIEGNGVSIGSINTGNSATVPASQSADQANHKRGSGSSKQSNNLAQVQKITLNQDSGDVKLWIDDSGVSFGSINTGNLASVSASQSAKQKNS